MSDVIEINPGIQKLVEILSKAGHRTVDSGDGETHDFECDRDHGYVVILSAPDRLADEADQVATLLRILGFRVAPQGPDYPAEGACWVEASYAPADGVALINVSHVHDRMLRLESFPPPGSRDEDR